MSVGHFLVMIGALVRDPHTGKYLILRRSPEKDVGAGIWECVTGRLDQGEGFLEAFHREVLEEIGVQLQPEFILRTTHFYRGEPIPENEMVGIMVACSLANPDTIQISWEHSEARWVTPDEVTELLPKGNWLVELIHRDAKLRSLMSVELLAYYQQAGISI
jgi:NADH pyrophosphatase NudC (nudix superfamily)